MGVEELQMRSLTHIALQGVFWGALYLIAPRFTNELALVAVLGATLAVSLTAAAVYFAKR